MAYRAFERPKSSSWNSNRWVGWARQANLLFDVRPDISEGVCDTCWGGTRKSREVHVPMASATGSVTFQVMLTRWPRCYNCHHFGGFEGVIPISYSAADGLEAAIWRAKNDPDHRWLNLPLAALLHRFIKAHLACIEETWGRVDIIAPVPSHTRARFGWDHMRYLVDRVKNRPFAERWADGLLEKVDLSTAGTRRGAAVRGLFRVARGRPAIAGKRVLLIDDTFTSGGTLRSAGLAIEAAGGLLPVALSIGRQVKPDEYGAHIVDDMHRRRPAFDLTLCAVHGS